MSAPYQLLGTALGAALLLSSSISHASGAILAPPAPNDASNVVLDVAVAITPAGTTRWSRVTVTASSPVLWLVPARPGAAVDWASDAFLDALDNAGAPRVLPPAGGTSPCAATTAERVASFGDLAPRTTAGNVTLETSADAVKSYATGRGFAVSDAISQRIDDAFAAGYQLVAIDIATTGAAVTTPTVRVSDDGAAVLPLALSGGTRTNIRVRANVIAEGAAELPNATSIDQTAITWGPTGSNYTLLRESAVFDHVRFVRESASHAFFASTSVPAGAPIPAVTQALFESDPRSSVDASACESAARGATTAPRVCAPGALLRVPGGTTCSSGGTSSFACDGVDDLAIALSGMQPANAILTQFSGAIPANGVGSDIPIDVSQDPAELENPLVYSWAFVPCGSSSSGSSGSSTATPAPGTKGTNASRPHHYVHDDSCFGSTTSVVYDDDNEEDVVDNEGCGSSSADESDSTSNDSQSCGSSSSTSSSSSTDDDKSSDDSSGWDKKDDDDSKSDSCSNDDSKSSSNHRHHGPSPVSRYALLFVGLILPLRRGLRAKKL